MVLVELRRGHGRAVDGSWSYQTSFGALKFLSSRVGGGRTRADHRAEELLPSYVEHAAHEYFSDGITEELIDALTHVEGLQVVSRTSAFSFKGKPTEVSEIGFRLKVATVLEGSVRREGTRLRLTAQLVDTANGFHLWSTSPSASRSRRATPSRPDTKHSPGGNTPASVGGGQAHNTMMPFVALLFCQKLCARAVRTRSLTRPGTGSRP